MHRLHRTDTISTAYTIDDFTDPWARRPYLLLQHGNGRSGAFWYRWIPYLARHYRIVRPDMRGLGQSSAIAEPASDLSLDALLGDLLALLDSLGADSVHFCGESMGGILGLALAATHPRRVRTLTLVSTPVFIEQGMKERYALGHGSRVEAMRSLGIADWVDQTTRRTRLPADTEPELFDWYVKEFVKGDPDVQLAMSALVNEANAAAWLPQVRAPVLGLYPTAGQITSENQERLLREGLRDLRIVHLPTGYHMVQLLYPATCARTVLAFCAAHDGLALVED
ncbi:MAG: alpha/beta hydrolase [Gammaproteobacteria bacterium]|nr:alpha/beta hydrolase [Gammaproteobacteria bacterium]